MNVEILAVNQIGADGAVSVAQMTSGRTLAVLQDTTAASVWFNWGITYRDVWVLDSSNRLAGVFNLTTHDLADPLNRATMKQLFLNAAAPSDSDADGLVDHWEIQFLKTLAQGKDDDADGDGARNFDEFALGSDPLNPASRPGVRISIDVSSRFAITFHRWGGNLAEYRLEGSIGLQTWASGPGFLRSSARNLFDGTGRFETTVRFENTIVNQPFGFLRLDVRALP